MRSLALAALALLALSGNAWAWGRTGHAIVCEIAFRLATAETQAEIRRVIRQDPTFHRYGTSCTWPDHPRKRASEHIISLARDSAGLTSDACPGADKCALAAIASDEAVLSSRSASDEDKLAALKFLGHWVGDIHQPLHVSFKDDRWGNKISVSGECTGTLHSTWDNCLVLRSVDGNVSAATTELLKSITPAMRAQWTASGPRDWANESFAIAKAAKSGYCVRHGSSCYPPPSRKVKIDAAYVQTNGAVVREQLAKAGVRLSRLLDRALGK